MSNANSKGPNQTAVKHGVMKAFSFCMYVYSTVGNGFVKSEGIVDCINAFAHCNDSFLMWHVWSGGAKVSCILCNRGVQLIWLTVGQGLLSL